MGRRGPLGKHTHKIRWERERRRTPEIAALSPGDVLRRFYAGKLHEVTCCDGHWLYNNKAYPTLYAIVIEIAGAFEYPRSDGLDYRSMANWSAARFFGLKEKKRKERRKRDADVRV